MPPGAPSKSAGRVLIIACGALAHELNEIMAINHLDDITVECLPAKLHNRPEQIPDAVRQRVRAAKGRFETILVGYMDCGTGGLLDRVCDEEGVERLPGQHCYALFAGRESFEEMHEAELGTLYLTDYMVKHFDRLIMEGLGIADHPELLDMYFANYTRCLHLAQVDDPELDRRAQAAAQRLGLRHERVFTGYGELGSKIVEFRERVKS